MNVNTKSRLAVIGESLAKDYLTQKNYQVIARNYHSAYGEIDIVALHQNEVVFVEVKTRSNSSIKAAENSVNTAKQKKITQTALHFLTYNSSYSELSCRFDVLLIFFYSADDTYKIIHHVNAFNPIFPHLEN
jgi:putative endonuclease